MAIERVPLEALVGLSTDKKPTDRRVYSGMPFFEKDTKKAFFYMNGWVPLGGEADPGIWGSISGTLSDQTDLQNELDKKLDNVYAHFKKSNDNPPSPLEGEFVYFTTVKLEGSVKVTEHKMKDSLGKETLIKTFKEVL